MRAIFVFVIIFIAFTASAQAATNDVLRASYEIKVEESGKAFSSIRTRSLITYGSPVAHKLGDYEVSFTFEPSRPEEYSLQLSVASTSSFPSSLALPLNLPFSGVIGGPLLEFSHQQGDLTISGVLRVFRTETQ